MYVKIDFEKKSADDKQHTKLPSRQRDRLHVFIYSVNLKPGVPEPYAKKMSQISLLLLEQTDQGLYLFAFTVNYLLSMDQSSKDIFCTE